MHMYTEKKLQQHHHKNNYNLVFCFENIFKTKWDQGHCVLTFTHHLCSSLNMTSCPWDIYESEKKTDRLINKISSK